MENSENRDRVLVVDDDENMRAALGEALGRLDLEIETASDGEEALRKVEANPPNLLLTDIRMPKMDGLELLEKVKLGFSDIPVIMMTAYGSVETSIEAMRRGASDYLLKPFSSEALESSISSVIGRTVRSAPQQPALKPAEPKSEGTRVILTQNVKMIGLLDIIDRTAKSKASVMVQGESGTGKELFARLIHEKSERTGPFVAVNCAALPESLLESELFGHEKGSFTGAISRKIGKFELADKGTLLLDEITEMQVELQAKLLRVIQEREIDRVGGTTPVPIDVRIVATTNRKLEEAISEGKFREDLFFRLNVIPVAIPPLRERPEDLELLIKKFTEKFAFESGKTVVDVTDETMAILKKFRWRGNVRELENIMERAVLLCRGESIVPEDLFLTPTHEPPETAIEDQAEQTEEGTSGTLEAMEKRLILGTLEDVQNNRTKAADMLGISIRTLRNKLNEYKKREDAA
jgi:DNA-binding NtrC family response regulator